MEKITVIIPVCNINDRTYEYRLRSLNYCFANFYLKQKDINLDIIVMEQIISDEFPTYSHNISVGNIRTVIVRYDKFNKPWLYNCGVNLAETEHIIFTEAEMFSDDELYFNKLINWVLNQKRPCMWAIGWNRLGFLSEDMTLALIQKNKYTSAQLLEQNKNWVEPIPRENEGGFVYFRKSFYKKIGMANEFMEGLGRVDNSIAYRAFAASHNRHVFPHTVYHLYHPKSDLIKHRMRNKNVAIFDHVKNHPLEYNRVLASYNQGNTVYPLCYIVPFSFEMFYTEEERKNRLIIRQQEQREEIKRIREKRARKK